MSQQEMQVLKSFEESSKWFYENMDKLRQQKLTNKFVAVKNSKLIAADKNIDIVIEQVEKTGENPSFIFIEFVYPEGYTLLL